MVYIEKILIFNCLIHLIITYNTMLFTKVKIKKTNLILSIILDMVYMIIYIYNPLINNIYKVMFIILIAYITFISNSFISIIKSLFIYYCLNFLIGGVSVILYISSNIDYYVIILLVIILLVFSYIYIYFSKANINIDSLTYDILIVDNNNKYYLKAYLDTGNFLQGDDFKDIVFISDKYKFGKFRQTLESKSIGVVNNINIYEVKNFYILINNKYVKKEVYVSFSKLHYDAMFGVLLLGG